MPRKSLISGSGGGKKARSKRELLVIGGDTQPLTTDAELPACFGSFVAEICSGFCGKLAECSQISGVQSFSLKRELVSESMLDTFSTVGLIPPTKSYVLCDSPKLVDWVFSEIEKCTDLAWDLETTHPTAAEFRVENDFSHPPIGISFSWKDHCAAYIPLYKDKDKAKFWPDAIFQVIVDRIKTTLENPKTYKHGQNYRFDYKVMVYTFGIYATNMCYDTMLMHHLLDENRISSGHALDDMAAAYLDPHFLKYDQVLQKALAFYDPKYKRYAKVPLNTIWPYACSDADATRLLAMKFEPMLKGEGGTFDLYHSIVRPLAEVMAFMEMTGLDIDAQKVENNKVELTNRLVEIRNKSVEVAGTSFDIGSPEQLGRVLFEHLKLGGGRRNKQGFSTDKEVLARLQDQHPLIALVQEYRRLVKLKGTYVEGLDKRLLGGRYYPPWNQIGTVSGRFSTELVNLLPREEHGGSIIKGQFKAPEGCVILFRDLSQIELRMGAHISQDKFMLEGYINGGKDFDLHAKTASGVFKNEIHAPAGWPDPNDFSWVKSNYKKYRSISKNINFLTAYGGGAFKLQATVNKEFPESQVTKEQAQGFIDDYFSVMTGLAECIKETYTNLRRDGYVESIFGRRRRLPDAKIKVWEKILPRIYYECFGRDSPRFTQLNLEDEHVDNLQTEAILNVVRVVNEQSRNSRTGEAPFDKCVRRMANYDSPEGYCTELVRCVLERERRNRDYILAEAQRSAFNFRLQSAAADYTNLGLVKIWEEIKQHRLKSRPVLQIHDALGFVVPFDEVETMLRLTKHYMENAYKLSLPIFSEAGVAKCWGEEDNKKPKECKACKSPVQVVVAGTESMGDFSDFTEYQATCTNAECWRVDTMRVFKTATELE